MSIRSTPTIRLRSTWWNRLPCLFIVLVSLTGLIAPVFAATRPSERAAQPSLSPDQQYKAAKESVLSLEQDRTLGKKRDNWLQVARIFRSLSLTEKKGALGPNSLYMTAKTHQRMYELFKNTHDLEVSLNTYLETADRYPGHILADDALMEAAECAALTKGKESLSVNLYQKVVDTYPQGDQYEKAKARTTPPAQANKQALHIEKPQAQPVVTQSELSQIFPAKYWNSKQYSRVVLQSTLPIAFTAGTMPNEAGQPRQLYLDLARSSLTQLFGSTTPATAGLLRGVRTEQHDQQTVRVLFDLESLSDYKVFSLQDPFRIVIDIRGASHQPTQEFASGITGRAADQAPAQSSGQDVSGKQGASVPSSSGVVSLTDQKKRPPEPDTPPSAGESSNREKLTLAQQLGLGIRKIIIDPGHGGKDPGAMAFGLKEKEIVLTISKKVAKILKENKRYEVELTRTKDMYLPLEERTAIANTKKADLFLSIHINAHADQSRRGIETYFLNLATDANAMRVAALENATSTRSISEMQDILTKLMKNAKSNESSRLARFVHTNLVAGAGSASIYRPRDLGVKQAPFYVLIGAQMPSILAEISFLTNPEEAKLLQNDHYLNKIAEQLAAGIAAYVEHHHTAAVKL